MALDLESVVERAEARNVPLTAVCEITNACNVDCEHCYLDLVPDAKIDALSTDEWKRIFRELRAAGTLFLTLTGGEVLVRRDWFELATYARELGFCVRIFTNGTLVDDKNADRIALVRPIAVEVSLLGGAPATHDGIARRRGAFDKTIAGVKRLRERGIPVVVKCVVMQKNVEEIAMIRAIGEELGCHVQFDVEVTPKNNGSAAPRDLVPEDDALVRATRALTEHDDATRPRTGPAAPPPRSEWLSGTPCSAARRSVHIGPTGNISPCTQWSGHPVGNLREKSFADHWGNNDVLKAVRAKRLGDFPVCARCDLLDICSPCMALSVLERGVIDGPSPTKCATAEMRAKAAGHPGRSAWLAQQANEPPSAKWTTAGGEPPRLRLPLVG